ncbi:MAG: hypothetical protein HHAS10_08620 [Candidatus Altimarinota bacterium]
MLEYEHIFMVTKEELILENELLKKKLALAEAWMRREVAAQQRIISRDSIKVGKRNQLHNVLERESIDILTRKIDAYFGDGLSSAPKYTLEHLIDAEIYWQTLQKFPTLDALPVVSSYQKILDAFFELILYKFRISIPKNQNLKNPIKNDSTLDKDIKNVIEKHYTLSLGRWFQFFEKVRAGSEFGGIHEDLLLVYLSDNYKELLEVCITDPVFSGFEKLIALEVFGRKRHNSKISYMDAKKVREVCVGGYVNPGIIQFLFQSREPK